MLSFTRRKKRKKKHTAAPDTGSHGWYEHSLKRWLEYLSEVLIRLLITPFVGFFLKILKSMDSVHFFFCQKCRLVWGKLSCNMHIIWMSNDTSLLPTNIEHKHYFFNEYFRKHIFWCTRPIFSAWLQDYYTYLSLFRCRFLCSLPVGWSETGRLHHDLFWLSGLRL